MKHIINNFLGGVNQSVHELHIKKNMSPLAYNCNIDNGNLSVCDGYAKYIAVLVVADEATKPKSLIPFFQADGTKQLLAASGTNLYKWTGSAWTSI